MDDVDIDVEGMIRSGFMNEINMMGDTARERKRKSRLQKRIADAKKVRRNVQIKQCKQRRRARETVAEKKKRNEQKNQSKRRCSVGEIIADKEKRNEQFKQSKRRCTSQETTAAKRRKDQSEHVRLRREEEKQLCALKKRYEELNSTMNYKELGDIGKAVKKLYVNTGGIENTVPKPPTDDEKRKMVHQFSRHVNPYCHRCQVCGLEFNSNDDTVNFSRRKVFLKGKLNPIFEHLKIILNAMSLRRKKFAHYKVYKYRNYSVCLAVCDQQAPETLIQHFMSSGEIADTIVGCEKCISNTNNVGFHLFDVGKYPWRLWKIQSGMDQRYDKLNLLEEMILSSRVMYYKLVKLSKSGSGLKGAAINLACTLNETVKLPRKDACKFITATIIGEKVNKKTSLKHAAYAVNKKVLGLKADIKKLNLFYVLIPDKFRVGSEVDWESVETEFNDDSIINDTSIETVLSDKTTSNSQTRENFVGDGKDGITEVYASEPVINLSDDEVLVPKMAELMNVENVEGIIRSGFMNEINMMGEILQEAFTYLFPLDTVDSTLPLKRIVHYLMHFKDKRFRKCVSLIIYLFDTLRRFDCFNATNYHMKAVSEKNEEFINAINDPNFKVKLRMSVNVYNKVKAIRDQLAAYEYQPKNLRTQAQQQQMTTLQLHMQELKASHAWKIFKDLNKQLARITHVTQPKIKWSVAERMSLLPIFYAYRDMFGCGNFWITITCQVYNSRLAFRLTLNNDKDKRKETHEIYEKAFKSSNVRFAEISNDPVARAETFRIIVDAVCIHLFGIYYTKLKKRTYNFKENTGLWGCARAFIAVFEATGTGLLHAHIVKWAFMHVALMRMMLADRKKRSEITAFIDAVVSAPFEEHVHEKYDNYAKKAKVVNAEKRTVNGKLYGFNGTQKEIESCIDELGDIEDSIAAGNKSKKDLKELKKRRQELIQIRSDACSSVC